jgi:Malectin-like domain
LGLGDNTDSTWTNISTSSTVKENPDFATPSAVMQTAAATLSTNQSLNISWTWDIKVTLFYVFLHISEIQNISSTALRKFEIIPQGKKIFNATIPKKLQAESYKYSSQGFSENTLWLTATSDSTLPPILNALEVYIVRLATEIPTYSEDSMFIYI